MLEEIGLPGILVPITKVAQADANQPVPLLGTEVHSCPKAQRDVRQLLTGGERRIRCLTARVRILNSLVFNFRTTVCAIRDSLREADQTFSASRRIITSVSPRSTSCSKVSSADMDWVGRSGTTGVSSIPRASSCR